jgi:hypothetical protein
MSLPFSILYGYFTILFSILAIGALLSIPFILAELYSSISTRIKKRNNITRSASRSTSRIPKGKNYCIDKEKEKDHQDDSSLKMEYYKKIEGTPLHRNVEFDSWGKSDFKNASTSAFSSFPSSSLKEEIYPDKDTCSNRRVHSESFVPSFYQLEDRMEELKLW